MFLTRLLHAVWLAVCASCCLLVATLYFYPFGIATASASVFTPSTMLEVPNKQAFQVTVVATPASLNPQRNAMLQAQPAATAPVVGPAPTFMPVIFAHYRPQAPRMGIALEGFTAAAGLRETLALGARWGRRWREIAWREVEPKEGEFHWDVLAGLEAELTQAAAVGLEPILDIQMTPEWAQKFPPYACGTIKTEKLGAFANFVEQLVKRYGTATPYGVRYWQLGNEPDIAPGIVGADSVFGCWGDQNDAYYGGGQYVEMLKVVYPRVKAADANAQIMLAGLLLECDPYTMKAGVDCANEERLHSGLFLEGVMKAGGGDFFDIADVHVYGELRMDLPARMHSYYFWSGPNGGTGLPEKVALMRKVMTEYGFPQKPIFAGEVALKCEIASDDCDQVGAAFIPRVYSEAYGLGLLGASYYALISEFKFKGLLKPDLTPKPAYYAYEFMSSQLHSVEYVGPVTVYPGVSGQTFKQSGISRLQIIWSTTGEDQTVILPDDFVQAYDRYGNAVQSENGQIVVNWAPLYLKLKFTNK
ncbi:hypothetical protein BH10CHL1_BH10CHL1_03230 [soil metagenome]